MNKQFFLIFIIVCFTTSFCFAQTETKITYSATNKSLLEIFEDIEQMSNYRFSFNSNLISKETTTSINIKNATIDQCLNKLLGDEFIYNKVGYQIILGKNNLYSPNKPIYKKPNSNETITETVYDTIPVYDTIIKHISITDTIFVYDTLKYTDTITVIKNGTNYFHTKDYTLSFWGSSGPFLSYPLFYNGGSYAKDLQKNNKYDIGFSIQLNAIYQKKNLLFQSGIGFYDFRQENSYSISSYTDDPNITYTDTLWFWEFTELFTYYKFNENGDSVAIHVLDSTYTYSLRENPKKIEHQTHNKSILSQQYLSIPVGIGYHYNLSKTLAIQPMVLLNTMFLITQRGYIPNSSMSENISIKDILKPITISTTLACNISYSLEEKYSVSLKPFCIFTPSLYKNSKANFSEMLFTIGFEWGFIYTIPYEWF